jgi:hypothetical protein
MLIVDVSEVKHPGEAKQNNLPPECGQPTDMLKIPAVGYKIWSEDFWIRMATSVPSAGADPGMQAACPPYLRKIFEIYREFEIEILMRSAGRPSFTRSASFKSQMKIAMKFSCFTEVFFPSEVTVVAY